MFTSDHRDAVRPATARARQERSSHHRCCGDWLGGGRPGGPLVRYRPVLWRRRPRCPRCGRRRLERLPLRPAWGPASLRLKVPAAVYRAFLLPSCLEVDLGFTPADRFGPVGPHFRAVFGEAVQISPATGPDPGHLIGLAWHHVLHARSCIERHKPWQAEYWISGIRDQTLALACLRLGEPAHYAKGADALPITVIGGLEDALVRSLEQEELRRALRVAATRLLLELHTTDAVQAQRLERPIRELADLAKGQPEDSTR